jgi:hypothetical protein
MHDIASEANEAIKTYNVDQDRLFASNYGDDTKEISVNAQKVSQRLHDDVKLADTKGAVAPVAGTVDKQSSNQAAAGSGL